MADDDILAAIGGLSQGVSSVLVPFFLKRHESNLRRKEREEELTQMEAMKEKELNIELKSPFKFGEDVTIPAGKYRKEELELLKPQPIVVGRNADGTPIIQYVQGGRPLAQLKSPASLDTGEDGTTVQPPATFEDKSQQKEKEIILRNLTQELPKLKSVASSQKTNIDSIDKALGLVDKGVTGKKGQLKAFLAGYSEFSGEEIENLSEAQTFQLLTRVIVGPMRLDIVGPGPVSEWEQKLMQQISGGGGSAKGAAKELLSTYRRMAKDKVSNYNTTLEGAIKLNKSFKDLYQPISVEDKKQVDANSNKDLGQPKIELDTPIGLKGKDAERLLYLRNKKRGLFK